MNDSRPDPERLLEQLRQEGHAEGEGRARLKIFFGASAGVGKTYAMLEGAHERRGAGVDVVVGLVETHGRAETQALAEGLDVLPRRVSDYRGVALQEFDLDAALARRPKLILLDELAHTNAPGSRHLKRWQDVEELLDAGIDVYTTLNVQHVESLYDLVSQITRVDIRETIPDSIIDRADEIELIDLPPDDLLKRLREGKIYMPEQAGRALENFFQKGNLIALRELALRRTAERVDKQMESYGRTHEVGDARRVAGRILVAIGNPEGAARLIRAARRMASSLRAEWRVVHVEKPGEGGARSKRREHLMDVMSFAEELGAETAILSGSRVSDTLLDYARSQGATRILIGKPTRRLWIERVAGSLVQSLIRESGDTDIVILAPGAEERGDEKVPEARKPRTRVRDVLLTLVVVGTCTLVARLMQPHFDKSNLIMVFLLGVIYVAATLGRTASVLASVLGVAAFDFFCVPPYLTFAVADTQYLVTMAVMLAVGLVMSDTAVRLREQAEAVRQRERRTRSLYRLSRELAVIEGSGPLGEAAVRNLEDIFDSPSLILLPDEEGRLSVRAGDAALLGPGQHDLGVATWVLEHGEAAGMGTSTLPASHALYLPLKGTRQKLGVLGVKPSEIRSMSGADPMRLLEAAASTIALALERSLLAERAERARLLADTEQMRNSLLSSVSHDLRTPLGAILGSATSLLEEEDKLSPETRRELARAIAEETQRLNRLVGNLLEMTRLQAGALVPQKEWNSVEEVIGSALHRFGAKLSDRTVTVKLEPGMPLVPMDALLIEQVLLNLVDNALKYDPEGGSLEIRGGFRAGRVELEVEDEGPGFPKGQEQQLFEKFQRGNSSSAAPSGAGLGLAICRGIVAAHGGTIDAMGGRVRGSCIRITLPVEGIPPQVESEEEGAEERS